MLGSILLIIGLVVLTDATLTGRNSSSSLKHDLKIKAGFTHLILAVQWFPGACVDGYYSNKPCVFRDRPKQWTIHGLWPADDTKKVEFCTNEPFNSVNVQNIRDIYKKWPSFTGSVFGFWGHEWKKHGTCAGSIAALRPQASYFKKTVELYDSHNIERYLRMAKIVPSVNESIPTSKAANAFAQYFKGRFDFVCGWSTMQHKTVLREIHLYFNNNLKVNGDKGKSKHRSCQENFYYLPL